MKNVIKVTGMTCKSCVMLIESELKDLDGIKRAKVKLADDAVGVEFDEQKVSLEKIKSTITGLGYGVDGKKPTGHSKKNTSFVKGIAYGLVPHIGCIAFIIASVLGATVMMNLFRPLLMSRYIFHALIGLSVLFAGASSIIYLRNNDLLSWNGIKKKKGYLVTMFGSTIGINIVLFFFIFPAVANVGAARDVDQAYVAQLSGSGSLGELSMDVDIPCPGHAPLITNELKTIDGVIDVQFSFPNTFDVTFDAGKTSLDAMLDLDVFDEYPATPTSSSGTVSAPAEFAQPIDDPEYEEPGFTGGCGCGGGSACGI